MGGGRWTVLSAPLGFFRYLQWSEGAYFTFKANFLSSRHSVSNYLLCTQRVLPNLCTATNSNYLLSQSRVPSVECARRAAARAPRSPAIPGQCPVFPIFPGDYLARRSRVFFLLLF